MSIDFQLVHLGKKTVHSIQISITRKENQNGSAIISAKNEVCLMPNGEIINAIALMLVQTKQVFHLQNALILRFEHVREIISRIPRSKYREKKLPLNLHEDKMAISAKIWTYITVKGQGINVIAFNLVENDQVFSSLYFVYWVLPALAP